MLGVHIFMLSNVHGGKVGTLAARGLFDHVLNVHLLFEAAGVHDTPGHLALTLSRWRSRNSLVLLLIFLMLAFLKEGMSK